MKSVLHVISGVDPVSGGPVTTLLGMACAQSQLGAKVYVATLCPKENQGIKQWVDSAQADQVNVKLIKPPAGFFANCQAIKSQIQALLPKIDVVHIHGMWGLIQWVTAKLCRNANVPYVIIPHGMLTKDSLSRKAMKKRIALLLAGKKMIRAAKALHFCSELERDLSTTFGTRSIVEPNGLDLREFSENQMPPQGRMRQLFPEIGDRQIVLFLGRLHPIKGLDILIPAFAKAKIPNTVLVLAGPMASGYEQTVQKMIAENQLQKDVILTGMMDYKQRIAAFNDAKLFVLSSYHENFGNVVVEALACAKPVIVSDHVNIHPYITQARVGSVVPLDAQALAQEITHWMTDKKQYDQAAARAKPYAWDQFDWKKIALRLDQHYNDLISNSQNNPDEHPQKNAN